MAAITAPMMECKKALTEADGDMAKAEELLRVKLGTKAGKAASRVTAEGVVTCFIDGTVGALLEVNCETDFVTKNDSFLAMANTAAALIAKHNPADIAALSALPCTQDGYGPTLEDVRKGLIGKIGENMTFRRFKRFASGAKLASYLHGSRIGVVIEFEGDDTAAKDVAMHVAAMKPVALSSADVPADLVAVRRNRVQADRRRRAEVPQGSQLVQPAVREERQADGRADAQGHRHHRQGFHPLRRRRRHRETGGRFCRRGGRPGGCRQRRGLMTGRPRAAKLTPTEGAHA